MDTLSLTTPDGRNLDVYVSGPADGPPLLFHHGTPGSGFTHEADRRATAQRGLRLVTFSRPGYGESTRWPGRTVADVVVDTAAVLAAVGADECIVAGHSGGGPHALACAARLPGVRAAFVIAGAGPADAGDLDFLAGQGEENLVEFGYAAAGEGELRPYLDVQRRDIISATPAELAVVFETILPQVDVEAVAGAYGEEIAANMAEALRVGVDGWIDDDLAFMRPWGFDLSEIAVPTAIWQGDVDLMVPFAHGQWLAEHVPGAEAHLLPGEGHLSIAAGQFEAMLDAALAAAGR